MIYLQMLGALLQLRAGISWNQTIDHADITEQRR